MRERERMTHLNTRVSSLTGKTNRAQDGCPTKAGQSRSQSQRVVQEQAKLKLRNRNTGRQTTAGKIPKPEKGMIQNTKQDKRLDGHNQKAGTIWDKQSRG